jgi:hypothetical protein
MLFQTSKTEKSVDEIVSEFDPSLIPDGEDIPHDVLLEAAKQNVGSQYLGKNTYHTDFNRGNFKISAFWRM